MTLSQVDAVMSTDGTSVDLSDIYEPDRLLDYYFGHGGRHVLLVLDHAAAEGRLKTRWETTGRHWWLELD